MKKNIIVLLIAFLFIAKPVYSGDDCLKVAKKLWKLQNSIVEKSFENLKEGAWAVYEGNLRVVYAGTKESPATGKKYYVVEYAGGKKGITQIWYETKERKIKYQGKELIFKVLAPAQLYISAGNNYVMHISEEAMNSMMNMGGKNYSTILDEANIFIPPDCDKIPNIKETEYTLKSGKKIKVVIIESKENKGKIYCSDEVPFGMVKVVNSKGSQNELIDFGLEGGKVAITDAVRKTAQELPVFNMPNMPQTPNMPAPVR